MVALMLYWLWQRCYIPLKQEGRKGVEHIVVLIRADMTHSSSVTGVKAAVQTGECNRKWVTET